MNCPGCGHDVAPVTEFSLEGMFRKCPRIECGTPLGPVETAQVQVPPENVAPTRQRKPRARVESFDVIKAAKARLRELDRQIRQLKKLEKEREQLKRLLDAAQGRPAEVKRLRAS